MKKYAFCILAVLLLSSMLFGCQSAPDAIKVRSCDYASLERMEPGMFDAQQAENWNVPTRNPYINYNCTVSVADGMLVISNDSQERKSCLTQFDNGYFVGTDLGELDGWVRYVPYHSTLPEAGDFKLVADENCRGIIARNRRNGYLLTAVYQGMTAPDSGKIYALVYSEERQEWTWNLLQALNTAPRAFFYDGEEDKMFCTLQPPMRYAR